MSRTLVLMRVAVAALALALPAVTLAPPMAAAQEASPIKRTPLQRFDVPGTNFETVIGMAEIVPDVLIGKHTHPGPESGFVLEGSFVLLIDGAEPLSLTKGQSYVVPAGVVHDAQSGPEGAAVVATYVVEKGQPLASPAN